MKIIKTANYKKYAETDLINRYIDDDIECMELKNALYEVIGEDALNYKTIVEDKIGVHEHCPYGFDLEIDKENKIILIERYENYQENSSHVIEDEIRGLFDGSTILLDGPTNLKRYL